jgi:hypothetical protein
VRRKELVLDLLVHRFLYRFAKQDDLLLLVLRFVPASTIPVSPSMSLMKS